MSEDLQKIYEENGLELPPTDAANLNRLEGDKALRDHRQSLIDIFSKLWLHFPYAVDLGFHRLDFSDHPDYLEEEVEIKRILKKLFPERFGGPEEMGSHLFDFKPFEPYQVEEVARYVSDMAKGLLDEKLMGALPLKVERLEPNTVFDVLPRHLKDKPLSDLLDDQYYTGLDIEAFKDPRSRTGFGAISRLWNSGKLRRIDLKEDVELVKRVVLPNLWQALSHFYTVESEKTLQLMEETRGHIRKLYEHTQDSQERIPRFLTIKERFFDPAFANVAGLVKFVVAFETLYKEVKSLVEKVLEAYRNIEIMSAQVERWQDFDRSIGHSDWAGYLEDDTAKLSSRTKPRDDLLRQIEEDELHIMEKLSAIFHLIDRAS